MHIGRVMITTMAYNGAVITIVLFAISLCNLTDGANSLCNTTGSAFISSEKKLTQCLMSGYDKTVRPAKNPKDVVTVVLNMVMVNIHELNEKQQTLAVNGWLHMKWHEPQLSWKPRDFGGVDILRIPTEKLWLPDIVLFNSAAEKWDYVMDRLALVQYDGTITWSPHIRLQPYCNLDMSRFPLDTQTCHMFLGSWTYDASKLDVHVNGNASREFLVDHNEWKVLEFHVKRHALKYTDSEEYPYIDYTVRMRRNSVFHRHMFIIPGVLMAFITAFIFLIPPEAGERMSLAVGVIIAVALLMATLEQYLPTDLYAIPIIGAYYTFNLVMSTIAIVVSIAVLNFHHRDIKRGKVPSLMRTIFLGRLSRLLCMKGDAYSALPTVTENASELRVDRELSALDDHGALPKTSTPALEKTLEEIRHYLKICASKSAAMQEMGATHRQLVINEWHQVALVVDRLMFILFVGITILITLIFFAR